MTRFQRLCLALAGLMLGVRAAFVNILVRFWKPDRREWCREWLTAISRIDIKGSRQCKTIP